jgi:hypothetical protein
MCFILFFRTALHQHLRKLTKLFPTFTIGSMSAGLHRILHSGHQDERLVGPALPWYNKPTERTGRYTTQWRRVDFDTTPAYGTKAVASIPVAGELLTRIYLVANLPSFGPGLEAARAQATALGQTFVGPSIGYTNSLGHALIRETSLTIGNTAFDVLTGRLLETLDEYETPLEKVPLVNSMIKRADNGFYVGQYGGSGTGPTTVAVPLPFWCVKGDLKTVLPLDALSASRVQVAVDFRSLAELYVSDAVLGTVVGDEIAEAETQTQTSTQLFSGSCVDLTRTATETLTFYTKSGGGTYYTLSGINFGDLRLSDTYLMVEYVYVDKLEAASWRNSHIEYPIVNHYSFPVVQTGGSRVVVIDLPYNNPVRFLYFSLQRVEAAVANMHFHAARDLRRYDLSGAGYWWPDASGLAYDRPGFLTPGYSGLESEPVASIELTYEGKHVKLRTTNPALYRSLLPSLEKTKTPWVNRYYYCIPLCAGPYGEVNWNKIATKTLTLTLTPDVTGQIPSYNVYCHVEACNVFSVYGGTASLLFDA